MTIRIGFAYNQKPAEEEPPSGEPPHSKSHSDLYAEWDDPATIEAVESALRSAGQVIRLEADEDFPQKLRATRPDIVFNIAEGLRGPNREGHVPAICEFYGIPYTGSDPLALSLGLDKRRAKEAFLARRVPTPAFALIEPTTPRSEWAGIIERLGPPVIVKPVHEGSSKGVPDSALCGTVRASVARVGEVLAQYDQPALIELFLSGREFTCAVLGNGARARVLPIVEVALDALPLGAAPIYGYEAKWVWDRPESPLEMFRCPPDVDRLLAERIGEVALGAYHALGCRDWARVDVRLDEDANPHVIEINPLPGILPDPAQNSCFPKAARAAGMTYDELIRTVLDLALERYGLRR